MTINVDAQELAKFSELAHRWWDPESEFRPLHQINPLRLDWIDELAVAARQDGARRRLRRRHPGRGDGAPRRATSPASTWRRRPLGVARLHALEAGVENIDYREIAAEALAAERPAAFDVVTCMEMLEHVPDPSSVVRACATLVKPGGWVFFSTLNRNPKSFLFAIVGAEYVLQLLPRGTHEYARFIRPSELARWCRDAGLELEGSRGHGVQPVHAALLAVGRHQRQLPVRLPQAGMRRP